MGRGRRRYQAVTARTTPHRTPPTAGRIRRRVPPALARWQPVAVGCGGLGGCARRVGSVDQKAEAEIASVEGGRGAFLTPHWVASVRVEGGRGTSLTPHSNLLARRHLRVALVTPHWMLLPFLTPHWMLLPVLTPHSILLPFLTPRWILLPF